MGGSTGRDLDTVINLVAVHHRCHRIIHANPDKAKEHGLIVPAWDAPVNRQVTPWPSMR